MEQLLANLKITVNKNLYLIDPTSSKLGNNIVVHSVNIIDQLGFEKFTFKKLGNEIESPEASIYRYFKNKNQLLSYLVSWYWGWMEYQLVFGITNLTSPELKIKKAIELITSNKNNKISIAGITINKLIRIVISESSKSYLTKDVTKANKQGAFQSYKKFVSRLAEIIMEINPAYKYPNMLLSTIIEGAHLQVFFAENLPSLTNIQKDKDYICQFYSNLVLQAIKNK